MIVPPASIFLPYDIRGVVSDDLNEESVRGIGRAIGSEARLRGVECVASGRDGRDSSPQLQQALNQGLLSSGVDVVDIGEAATPLLYYAAENCCAGSGVMVTGSHNPPEYNGIKIMLAGETLYGEAITALRQRIVDGELNHGEGRLETKRLQQTYMDEMSGKVALQRGLKVVVDCGNGMASQCAVEVLQRLGCEAIPLYCEVDGSFPNHHPDPNRPENMRELQARVVAEQADLGIAFDGDGDRLGVVAPSGEIIWPDRLMMLYARDLLSRHPGAEVIYDIKCSRYLGKEIVKAGGVADMWRTGHSMLKARMAERDALLAGEMSGHILLKEGWYGFDDALFAAVRLLQLLSYEQDIGALFDSLPRGVSTPELHIRMAPGEHYQLMERLLSQSDYFVDAAITTIDGLRVEFEDGWGLVRASNTTPTLVLRFEADSDMALQRIMKRFHSILLELQPTIQLPF